MPQEFHPLHELLRKVHHELLALATQLAQESAASISTDDVVKQIRSVCGLLPSGDDRQASEPADTRTATDEDAEFLAALVEPELTLRGLLGICRRASDDRPLWSRSP